MATSPTSPEHQRLRPFSTPSSHSGGVKWPLPKADIWIALAWCVGILTVAYLFAMVTYRRRIS
jgi:hypothetical protein